MKRLLPSPALSVALFVLWILLSQSVDPGSLVLGAGLALSWPLLARRLAESPWRPRRPVRMARLLGRVVADMLKANAQVAWALLTRRASAIQSRFVTIPLELKDPGGLTVLAMVITFTPGTAWVELSLDRHSLLLHVFDARDDASVIAAIKGRYEGPLREIFE